MNRPALAVLAILGLALTGCAASNADAAAPASAPSATVAPLTAQKTAPTATASPDDAFLTKIRAKLEETKDTTQIPDVTDEQLIAAGHDACAQMESGKKVTEVRVIDGEKPDALGDHADSLYIAAVATLTYCTQFKRG